MSALTLEELIAFKDHLLDPAFQKRERELARKGREFYEAWVARMFGFESAEEMNAYFRGATT